MASPPTISPALPLRSAMARRTHAAATPALAWMYVCRTPKPSSTMSMPWVTS
ncbi:hypothetical protein [Nonomuraea turkmeniaca]|uniref:hypothetical protein n=1 Tax=Nonomuraea turkmeniaca TaxID=103838 RepID=UPI0014776E46|nr:hypothetical protein [Nonomuraea turkmeniaca]